MFAMKFCDGLLNFIFAGQTLNHTTMKKLTYLFVSAIFMMASCQNQMHSGNAEMEAKNKEAVQKVFDAFSSGNSDSLANYVAENMIDHNPDPMVKSTGLQELKDVIAMYH